MASEEQSSSSSSSAPQEEGASPMSYIFNVPPQHWTEEQKAANDWRRKPQKDAWYSIPEVEKTPAPTLKEAVGGRDWSKFKQWWHSWSVFDPLPWVVDDISAFRPEHRDPYRWSSPETQTTEEFKHRAATNFPSKVAAGEYMSEIWNLQNELEHCYNVHQGNRRMACGLLERRYIDMTSTFSLMNWGFFTRYGDKHETSDLGDESEEASEAQPEKPWKMYG